MPHYFIEPHQLQGSQVVIEGELYRHLAGALRLRIGESVTLVDGAERLYGQVTGHEGRRLVVAVDRAEPLPPPLFELTLAIGLPKGKKLEEIVKRAVELGVGKVVPVVTSRSIAKGREGRSRADRLEAIALEAAQQSGRERVPEVLDPVPFARFLEAPQGGAGIVLYERESDISLAAALAELEIGHGDCKNYPLFIGPEGGLSEEEVTALTAKGWVRAGLGPYILRTETACFAALAVAGAVLRERFRP